MTPLVLDSLFSNKPLASLIILEDCPSQSALPILCHLIQQATTHSPPQQDVVFIKTNADLLLNVFQKIQSNLDSFHSFTVPNLIHLQSDTQHEKFHLNHLLDLVRNVIVSSTKNKSVKPTSIFLDSVQELFRLFSVHETYRFIKNLLCLLPNTESRLIIIDSPHLNLGSRNNECLERNYDASTGLRSLALSTSQIHLRIHPTSLLDHLMNDLGLTVPYESTKQVGTHYDVRLFQLIEELASHCDGYLIETEDQNNLIKTIPQALLIPSNSTSNNNHLGSCVVHWTAKNLQSSCRPSSASIKSNSSGSKKSHLNRKLKPSANLSSLQHGLEALQLSPDPLSYFLFQLSPLPISKVINKRSFKLSKPVAVDQASSGLDSQLTFNLSLTEKQRLDREAVELPYLPKRSKDGSVVEAPGEMYDGSFQKSSSTGGVILYQPDSADDFDDEEPDDD